MTKPRATPLAAQVEAAVERAEKAEGQVAALDYGLKAAHHQARCLKGELTKLQEAQKAAKARIKELEADQKPAPPPDKSECPLYGKAATMKTVFELYDIEAAARRAMQRELGTVSAMLTATERALASAKHRGDDYLYMYNAALRQLADQRAYHEAAKLKPGNCVSVPSPNYGDEPSLFPFFAGGLSGAVLGGVSALIACGGLL